MEFLILFPYAVIFISCYGRQWLVVTVSVRNRLWWCTVFWPLGVLRSIWWKNRWVDILSIKGLFWPFSLACNFDNFLFFGGVSVFCGRSWHKKVKNTKSIDCFSTVPRVENSELIIVEGVQDWCIFSFFVAAVGAKKRKKNLQSF